jgi:hypothetical protein
MKKNLYSFLGVTAIILLTLLFLVYLIPFVIYYRIREKGYSPLWAIAVATLEQIVLFIIVVPILGVIFVGAGRLYSVRKLDQFLNADSNSSGSYYLAVPVMILLFLLSVYCIRFLPTRRRKARAVSTIPFLKKKSFNTWVAYIQITFSYYLLRVIAVVLAATFVLIIPPDPTQTFAEERTSRILFWGLILTLVIVLWTKVKKRLRRIKEQEKFDQAKNPFILYLRSFSVEMDIFYIGRVKGVRSFLALKAFDQFFSTAVNTSIGPLIALGSPIDHWLDRFLWHNSASARMEYADDLTWKDNFLKKLDHSTGIFLHTAITDNIDFELGEILHGGHASKLFIMTRPPMETLLVKGMIPFWNWLRGTPAIKWAAVAGMLNRSGYEISPAEPKHGSLITFDSDNKAVLLKSGLVHPDEYVREVQGWLHRTKESMIQS